MQVETCPRCNNKPTIQKPKMLPEANDFALRCECGAISVESHYGISLDSVFDCWNEQVEHYRRNMEHE